MPRRLAKRRTKPAVHGRRRLRHVLHPAARLHRFLLLSDRTPSLEPPDRPSGQQLTRRRQHTPFEDAPTAHAGHRGRVVRRVLAAVLRRPTARDL